MLGFSPTHTTCCLHYYAGSLSYTSRADFCCFFVFVFYIGEVSLTHPVPASFSASFLFDGISYTSYAGVICIWGVSLAHPVLALYLCGEFLLHIPCWLLLFLIWGVSFTHPVLALFFCGEFLLNIPCWLHFYVGSFSYTSLADFNFIWGVSLTHPMMTLILFGEFLLHIPCWFEFYLESFAYTSHADFIFI